MNGSRHRIRHFGVRWNPLALVIAMKIDRSGSLSFAIRGIPSSIRPPNRHSGEGRNPGGEGCGNDTRILPLTNASNLHTLVCRHPPA